MNHSLRSICVAVLTGLCILAGPSLAEDDAAEPTAAELFEQFMDQYSRGEYLEAKKTARRIDPVQLPSEQRVALYEKIKQIDIDTTEVADQRSVLEQADAAHKQGDLGKAIDLYKNVLEGKEAGKQHHQIARARLAEIIRVQDEPLARLRQAIVQAGSDISAGRYDAADQKLALVRSSGVKLGWFDQQRFNRQLAVIEEHRRRQPPVVSDAEPLKTATTASPPAKPAESTPAPPVAVAQPLPTQTPDDSDASIAVEVMTEVEQVAQRHETAQTLPGSGAGSAAGSAAESGVEPAQDDSQSAIAVEVANDQDDDLLQQAMKQRASELVDQARLAEANGQNHLAAERFARAAQQDPTNGDAQEGYVRLVSADNVDLAPRNVLEGSITGAKVRVQAVIAEYLEKEHSARQLREDKKYSDALREIQQAKILLDRNEHLLPTATRTKYRGQAEQLEAEIRLDADEAAVEHRADEQKQRDIDAAQRRVDAENERLQNVQELLRRALEFNKAQRYSDALRELDKALFIEPTNPAAELLRQAIADNRRLSNAPRRRPNEASYRDRPGARQMLRRRDVTVAEHRLDNIEATTPVTELVTYPEDWPQLTNTRLAAMDSEGAESEVNRAVQQQLQQPLDLPFKDNDLTTAIDLIRQKTQLNIVVNWAALEAAGIEQDMPIRVPLTNVPAIQALKLVLAQASANLIDEQLDFTISEGIVNISTEADLTRETLVTVYDIRDLLADIPNFDDSPQFDLSEALSNTSSGGGGRGGGNTGGGGGGGSSGSGSGGGGSSIFGDTDTDSDDRQEEAEERRLEQIEDISQLIRDTVGNAEDWVENGGSVSSLRELNGQLIVKSTPENHSEIFGLLADLRETRAIQIHVEGRFLLVDQNFIEEFGMDLDVRIPDPGGSFGPISIAQDSFSLSARPSTGIPGGFLPSTSGNFIGPLVPSLGFVPSGRSLDFNLFYLDDIELNLLIRATQASKRSIALTAPRITFFNGQRAFVYVARQITFISDLEPVPDAGGFDPTLSVISSGVVLSVTGTVSSDRRYVTLTVEPSLATVVQPIRQISQSALVDIPGGDPNDPDGTGQQLLSAFIEAPEIEITEARATVSVPDGGTLLMGGQRLIGEIEVEAGVPVLSKVPILKRFFTNRSKVKDERTLLILIKPTIIIQNEEEERLFPGLVQNP